MGSTRKTALLLGVAAVFPLILILGAFGLIAVVGGQTAAAQESLCTPSGPAVYVDVSHVPKGPVAGFAGTQLINAAYIAQAGKTLGMSRRDQQIAIMTAMGESSLVNLPWGDEAGPDSRGLFQQRDNGAWGSLSDRMDPYIAATNFYRALAKVTNRDAMIPTLVANKVQVNANPFHYVVYWSLAGEVLQALVKGEQVAASTQSRYKLGPVSPSTALAANTLGEKFHARSIKGNPGADQRQEHAAGRALDITLDRPDAHNLVLYALTYPHQLGIESVVYRGHGWSAERTDEGWRRLPPARNTPAQKKPVTKKTANKPAASTPAPKKPAATPQKPAQKPAQTSDPSLPQPGRSTPQKKGKGPHPQETVHLVIGQGMASVGTEGCQQESVSSVTGPQRWVSPVVGTLTSPYGLRVHPLSHKQRWHYGVDLAAGCGIAVVAANSGTVVEARPSPGYGTLVSINHGNNVVTRYGHMYLQDIAVKEGQKVHAGQRIGGVGSAGRSTGCHMHFEIRINSGNYDPQLYYQKVGVKLGA